MSIRKRLQSAVWPALFGLYAAHQFAYLDHQDAHIHGYLDRMGPGVLVAVTVGWLWTWQRSRSRFTDVLAIQVTLFGIMEFSERVLVSDFNMLGPVLVGAALVPVAAGIVTVIDRMSVFGAWSTCRVHLLSRAKLPRQLAPVTASISSPLSWGIRGPPIVVAIA